MLIEIYNTILYAPLLNLLVFFYNVIPGQDMGVAIIALTLLIKLVLFPLTIKSLRSQKALQSLQPKIDELKERYKDKKEAMAKAMMGLYKTEKVSPFSSCLPMLIQLPILLAVYQVFRQGIRGEGLELLYSFVQKPESINPIFMGIINLSEVNVVLAILTGIAQFFQAKMLFAKKPPEQVRGKPGAKDETMMAMMNKQMVYFMPVFTVIIGVTLPSGLVLYWLVTTLIMILQQVIFLRKKKEEPAGDAPAT